jgi:hypothetical protein
VIASGADEEFPPFAGRSAHALVGSWNFTVRVVVQRRAAYGRLGGVAQRVASMPQAFASPGRRWLDGLFASGASRGNSSCASSVIANSPVGARGGHRACALDAATYVEPLGLLSDILSAPLPFSDFRHSPHLINKPLRVR